MLEKLSEFQEVQAGFSVADDGPMALAGGFENRQRWLRQQGLSPKRLVHAGLCHGVRTAVVTSADAGKIINNADGLITSQADLGLVMTAADCLLISAFDPHTKVIGLVHAGRKGLARHVVSEFMTTWWGAFPANPAGVLIDVSPSICPAHYTVSLDDAKHFTNWPSACQLSGSLVHLDLRLIARQQMIAAGIAEKNITISPTCTFEDQRYFSYRRDQPEKPQLQIGYITR